MERCHNILSLAMPSACFRRYVNSIGACNERILSRQEQLMRKGPEFAMCPIPPACADDGPNSLSMSSAVTQAQLVVAASCRARYVSHSVVGRNWYLRIRRRILRDSRCCHALPRVCCLIARDSSGDVVCIEELINTVDIFRKLPVLFNVSCSPHYGVPY